MTNLIERARHGLRDPRICGFLAVASLVAVLPDAATAAAQIAPPAKIADALISHRAVYEMSMGESRSGSGVSGVSGRMVFEFTGAVCQGFSLNMRMVTRISDQSGKATVTDLRSSSWEDGKGNAYRFDSSQYLNEKLSEETSGEAERASREPEIHVKLAEPESTEIDVGGRVLFPTQHSFAILEAAMAGRSLVQARVYDGSEKGSKVYDTTTYIGQEVPPGSDNAPDGAATDKVLDGLRSWPVSIAYFEPGGTGEAVPSYELKFRLYENGVSRDLVIDYGDFSIKGKLVDLDVLRSPDCKGAANN